MHDLSRDEEQGGHTLRKHVGRSDSELSERLRGSAALRQLQRTLIGKLRSVRSVQQYNRVRLELIPG